MMFANIRAIKRAPKYWSEPCVHQESKLHQLSPYIGKLKSSIASDLLASYTRPGDTVLDPFCGSGTVPLEAAINKRLVLAGDASEYATVLTRAKLNPPASLASGLRVFKRVLLRSQQRPAPDLRAVPPWVRQFFHPETLRESILFADQCLTDREDFLLACFLGILHHQRPGFLSFPSSHLVPYLRENKFPRRKFPKLYEYRELEPRMIRKLERALKDEMQLSELGDIGSHVVRSRIENFKSARSFSAIVTSPPYMNALDYRRDNRLRLWFLERDVKNYAPEPTDRKEAFAGMMRSMCTKILPKLPIGGHCVMVVGETVERKRVTSHPAVKLVEVFQQHSPEMKLVSVVQDKIPDVRRARRTGGATKTELVLVFEKAKSLRRKT